MAESQNRNREMNNGQDREALANLEQAVKDMHKALEKITTNDLPHITRKLGNLWTVVFYIVLPVLLIIFGSVIVKFIVE